MNVLVVGGTGFVGTHLCRELVERGHHVTALSRSPEDADLPPEVDRVMGDVTAYDSIEAAFEGQDAVVYLTALSPLFKPKGGYDRHFEVHLGGTENCVRAAEEHGVRKYVQMSAISADPHADTAYLRAKGEAEDVVRGSELDWTIFRPTIIFGAGEEFVPFTKLLAPPYLSPLPGGGKSRFQPIWVEEFVPMMADVVEGSVSAEVISEPAVSEPSGSAGGGSTAEIARAEVDTNEVTTDPHVGETYEIGGPEALTMAEVARLGHAADGKPTNVYSIPMPLVRFGLSLADPVPFVPFGADQYRSLSLDATVADNDVTVFGVDPSELTTLAEYLGVDPSVARTGRP